MLPETRIVSDVVRRITEAIRREVREKLGPNSTFEQRRDAAAAMASDSLWLDTDQDLREAITTAEEIEVDGRRYRPLAQASSATYHGRWGSHHIEEALYREVGVHNGPTIKPIELRVGIVEHSLGTFNCEDHGRYLLRGASVMAPPPLRGTGEQHAARRVRSPRRCRRRDCQRLTRAPLDLPRPGGFQVGLGFAVQAGERSAANSARSVIGSSIASCSSLRAGSDTLARR